MVVVRGLPAHEQSRDGGHLVEVHPQPSHREVGARGDAHGHLVGVLPGGVEVHLEQVAVARGDGLLAQPLQRVAEVEVDRVAQRPDAAAGLDLLAGVARGDVARGEVAEGRVLALQVVVALVLGDLVRGPLIPGAHGHPDASVVAQRLAHERRLGLPVGAHRQRRGVELHHAGRGEGRPAPVGAPGGGGVGGHGQGRVVVDAAVAAGGQHDGVRGVGLYLAGEQVPGDDALRAGVGHDEVEHLGAGVHADAPGGDLLLEGLGAGDLQLLTGLPARVVGARDLHPAEGAGGELAAVLAGEGRPDRLHVVDDPAGLQPQAHDVGLPPPVVPALDGVLDEARQGVAVDLAGPGGVDPALRGHRVGAARGVVQAEALHPVAQAPQGRGRSGAGQSGAHHDDGQLAAVGGIDQAVLVAPALPGMLGRAVRQVRIQVLADVVQAADGARHVRAHPITPVQMRTGSRPLTTATARATARARARQALRGLGPVPPRSMTTFHRPCARWRESASMTRL